ncbi:hypothetical protein [Streptomyces sp. NPDC088258]|uniref:hypothetical protein n=1 Tax=Streptomyces sp. NPDC088258 TaxID=3365849 RepID=UPI00382035EC
MAAIRLADLDIRWTGTDGTTPDRHVLVLGVDILGNTRLCLYAGDSPADDAFRGSLVIPPPDRLGGMVAYGPTGAHVTSLGDQTSMLARLATL